jgi:hypothetical protein
LVQDCSIQKSFNSPYQAVWSDVAAAEHDSLLESDIKPLTLSCNLAGWAATLLDFALGGIFVHCPSLERTKGFELTPYVTVGNSSHNTDAFKRKRIHTNLCGKRITSFWRTWIS